MSFISAVPENKRPGILFQSFLFLLYLFRKKCFIKDAFFLFFVFCFLFPVVVVVVVHICAVSFSSVSVSFV